MNMNKIENNISIRRSADVVKKIFINKELFPKIESFFYCSNCQHKNNLLITPYKTGFPFNRLYTTGILTQEDIVKYRIAINLAYSLPILYFSTTCEHCQKYFLVVFIFGEKQPGLDICEILGVWEYELTNSNKPATNL